MTDSEKTTPKSEGRMFPIQDGPDVPWWFMELHREQVEKNHCGQTLERLAERHGLSCFEANVATRGRGLFDRKPSPVEKERRWLAEKLMGESDKKVLDLQSQLQAALKREGLLCQSIEKLSGRLERLRAKCGGPEI